VEIKSMTPMQMLHSSTRETRTASRICDSLSSLATATWKVESTGFVLLPFGEKRGQKTNNVFV